MPKVRPTQALRPKPLGSQREAFLQIASQRELEGFLKMIGRGLDEVAAWGEERTSKEGRNIGTAHARIVAQAMLGLAKWPKVVADTNFKKALEAFWLSVMKDMEEEKFPAQNLVFIFARPGVQSNVPAEIRGSEETALGTYARVVHPALQTWGSSRRALRDLPGGIHEALWDIWVGGADWRCVKPRTRLNKYKRITFQ